MGRSLCCARPGLLQMHWARFTLPHAGSKREKKQGALPCKELGFLPRDSESQHRTKGAVRNLIIRDTRTAMCSCEIPELGVLVHAL